MLSTHAMCVMRKANNSIPMGYGVRVYALGTPH
jgi:hypothetical protein